MRDLDYRAAMTADADTLSMLATQVFLDTYATAGIDAELAREARSTFSPETFARRLRDPSVEIWVVAAAARLVGFVDIAFGTQCPVRRVQGGEVFRLYVQRPFQRQGVGRRLMARAEAAALARGRDSVWLTAWVGNANALAFYGRLGYEDVGSTAYVIEGTAYENRVLAKSLAGPGA